MGKTFQAAQLSHKIFLTLDHSCEIFFWYLINWTSTESTKFGPISRKNWSYPKLRSWIYILQWKKIERLGHFRHRKLDFESQIFVLFQFSTTFWKFSWADIKKIFRKSDIGSKNSHVLLVQPEIVFPVFFFFTDICIFCWTLYYVEKKSYFTSDLSKIVPNTVVKHYRVWYDF